MLASFRVRLATAAGETLAQQEVLAKSQPQGQPRSCPFFVQGGTPFTITRGGVATQLLIEWWELEVARVASITPTTVKVGQIFTFNWIEPVWLVHGLAAEKLPEARMPKPGDQVIQIPVGMLAAQTP